MSGLHRKLRRSGAGQGGAVQQHQRCAAHDSAGAEDLGRVMPPRQGAGSTLRLLQADI